MSLPPLAILAGGMATRLGSISEKIPKSLVKVAGKPFIDHQFTLLHKLGISEVVVCAGHLGGQIQDYVKNGSAWGLKVAFSFDGPTLIGTGGALKKALPLLGNSFFILYGDSYLEAPLAPIAAAFSASQKSGLMTVYKNEGKHDKSNVEFKDGQIAAYDKASGSPALRHIDYGLGMLRKNALEAEAQESFDLASFYGKLVASKQLMGYEVGQRFYEIGSPQGLAETDAYLGKK